MYRRCLGFCGLLALAWMMSANAFAQSANWQSGPYIGAFGGYDGGYQGQADNCAEIGGGHGGGHVGGGHGPGHGDDCSGIADGQYSAGATLGGALIGYRVPFFSFLVGIEGDIAGGDVSGSSQNCGASIGNPHQCGGQINAVSDLRMVVGMPIGQFLPFLSGGLAVDDIHTYDSFYTVSGTKWEAGSAIGAGVEYQLTSQIGLRLEYIHQQFGPTTYFDIVAGVPEHISTATNIVRAGIDFYFNPPPR